MKNIFYIILLFFTAIGCSTTAKNKSFGTKYQQSETSKMINDTVRIANEELEYEVVIIDSGFASWFNSFAKPRNYYSQSYLEARNRDWVLGWNNKFYAGNRFFEMPIDYQNTIDYGYEVNYMLYNYLTYFQLANKIKLGGFAPRI